MSRFYNSKQKQLIWEKDKGICQLCGLRARKKNWEADHDCPYSLGGDTSIGNGQVSHPWCNREKNNRSG